MASTQTSAASALQKLLSQDEYQSLSPQLSSKLGQAFQEQADECACLLTLHESEKQKNGDLIAGLRKDIESNQSELNNTQQKLVALSEENKTLASKYNTAHEKLEHAEATRRTLEKSVDELRHQRDTSTFSANALQSQFDFKETQLAQLKADMEHLRSELDAAVQSKFQAMVNQDEVEVKGKELQLKEAQLDKDRARMQQQIDMLNTELDKRNNDTIELRKESNKTFLELQNKLELRTSQHNSLEEKYKRLEQLYKERTKETNELRDRLTGQAQDEIDYRVHLEAQLNAQKAFVQAHKEALDATKIKCADMESTIVELKTRLDTQNETQAQLEAENEELKRELAARVEHFNEQMKAADEMLFAVKSENLDKSLETLSPYAVEISKRLREGLTYTDVIKLYAEASEELVVKQGIIEALQGDMGRIMEELKEVAPKMRRKCDRLHDALQVIDHLTCAKEKLDHEKCLVEKERDEIKTQLAVTRRDNDRNKAYVKDLCKQLCLFVKKEAEERGIPVPVTEDRPPAVKRASLDLSSLVENRLLTFSCVEELQQRNLELLEAVRILEHELQQKSETLSEMKMQQIQQDTKSDTGKQLEELKAQNETQKQHLKYLMVLLRQPSGDTSGIEYNEEFQSFTARTRVSVEVQTDDSTVQYTVKDVEALRAESSASVAKLESRVTELLSSESKLRQELRTAESEAAELKIKLRKVVTENEYKEEMLTTLRHNAEITSAQVATLEKSSQSYRESCIKNESVVSALHEQLKTVSKKLAQTEVDAEQYKRDLANMREKVKDLTLAKEVLSKEQNLHVQLMSHIEGIKTQMDLSESMGKAKLESKLEDALKEVNGLRHKLSEEQNMHSAKIEMLNKNVNTMKRRVDEEIEAKNKARQDLVKVKEELTRMESEVERLRGEVDSAKRVTVNTGETDKQVDQLKYEIMKLQAELKENQNMVTVTKQNEKSIQEICTTFEKHNRELTSQVKTAEATHQAKVAELTKQINQLTNELKKRPITAQQSIPQTPVVSKSSETSEVGDLRQQLEDVREQLQVSEIEREKALASYVRELQVHAEDSQVLPKLKQELSELKSALQTLENEKQAIQAKLVAAQNHLKERDVDVETEQNIVRQELAQARSYNETLFKALDELNSECNLSLNEIENSDQELRGNENVISVIKHLRQQSSMARIDKQNIECENKVMKSELDMLKRKLNESNELLNSERNKNQVNEKTLEKHTELVKKIEMMEVVSDSNRILREDRDKLQAQLNAVMKEKETFDAKNMEPLRAKIKQLALDLETRNQLVEHLKKQSESWKKRSESLVVKANKSNPEDIERLNLEKETLSKQLKSERESYHANLEDLKTLRAENGTQRDQINQLTKQINELKQTKEQLLKVKSELETCKTELAQLTTVKKELETSKTEITNLTTQLETTNQKLAAQGQQLENTRKLALQLRGANAKMKKEKEDADKAQALKTRTEEEDKTKNEAHEALIKEKDEQIAKIEGAKTNLETEMNNFKATLTQREERMKEVLKKCRQKMASQVLEMNQLKKQNAGGAGPSSGPSPDYEKLERTIAELREEKDKLVRDHEALQQKYSQMLSRHLSVQGNSESMGAKPAQEPPTANIKPMSGAVTPWRETPFASIRPMLSMEPRTVVVTPTALQPQNLEPSSSHMDYIASTSTAVRQATILPTTMQQQQQQQPLQQTGTGQQIRQTVGETAAESTQHEEVESPELEQQQSSSTTSSSTGTSSAAASAQAASIVALVLPQERQDSTASQQMVSGSSSGVTGSSAGNSSQQQLVSGSSGGAQTQQRVTGSSANGSGSQQQLVSGSNNSSSSSSSSSTTSSSQTSQQMVTGSNQQDEPVAGPSQQYRQEVPSTSTNQQVSDNSSNTVTTSRTSTTQKRARSPSDVTDSLVTAEPISIEEEDDGMQSVKRRRVLEVEYQVPTSSQRDQEDEIVIPDSDEEEEEEEDGVEGGEGEEEEGTEADHGDEEEEEEMVEGGEVELEEDRFDEEEEEGGAGGSGSGSRHHGGYEIQPDGGEYDETNTQPNSAEPSSSQPPSYDETGDGIVPSTPTLFVPRRTDAVSSPHVPSGRFTFGSEPSGPVGGPGAGSTPGAGGVTTEPIVDLTLSEEPGTSRSVPEQVVIRTGGDWEQETGAMTEPVLAQPGGQHQLGGVIDLEASEVSSEGERSTMGGEAEEGREAEAVTLSSAQRIPPLVTMRRGNPRGASRASRVTPIPIVWEEEGGSGRGAPRGGYAVRGGPRGRRGGRPPYSASSSSFNRYNM